MTPPPPTIRHKSTTEKHGEIIEVLKMELNFTFSIPIFRLPSKKDVIRAIGHVTDCGVMDN